MKKEQEVNEAEAENQKLIVLQKTNDAEYRDACTKQKAAIAKLRSERQINRDDRSKKPRTEQKDTQNSCKGFDVLDFGGNGDCAFRAIHAIHQIM